MHQQRSGYRCDIYIQWNITIRGNEIESLIETRTDLETVIQSEVSQRKANIVC